MMPSIHFFLYLFQPLDCFCDVFTSYFFHRLWLNSFSYLNLSFHYVRVWRCTVSVLDLTGLSGRVLPFTSFLLYWSLWVYLIFSHSSYFFFKTIWTITTNPCFVLLQYENQHILSCFIFNFSFYSTSLSTSDLLCYGNFHEQFYDNAGGQIPFVSVKLFLINSWNYWFNLYYRTTSLI